MSLSPLVVTTIAPPITGFPPTRTLPRAHSHTSHAHTHTHPTHLHTHTCPPPRRVAFVSLLALIPAKAIAGFLGIGMAITSAILYDKGSPFTTSSTNTMAAVSSLTLSASYASGLLIHVTRYGDDWTSGTVILILNLAVVPLGYRMARADAKARAEDEETRRKMYSKLGHAQVQDRRKYDIAWEGYLNHDRNAGPLLLANLLRLAETVRVANGGSPSVAHPASVGNNLDEMMQTASAVNDSMHAAVRLFVITMGARAYDESPLKKKERVEEKMLSDYSGNFLQVIGAWPTGLRGSCGTRYHQPLLPSPRYDSHLRATQRNPTQPNATQPKQTSSVPARCSTPSASSTTLSERC